MATTVLPVKRSALLCSTALQAAVGLALAGPATAQPAPSARPIGGRVVAGTASIGTTPTTTTITQSSSRAAVDWQSFDVGRDQSVQFQQPSPSAVTLNRVTGKDPSAIAGQISANGQIVITNRSGVVFYQGAEVNAQSVVVSAAGISNQNFMAGRMVFDRPAQPNARVENQGTITVKQAGLAALVAPSVANSGVINARLGQVVLAGAAAHTLDMYGDGLVSIDVTKQVLQAPAGPDGKPVTALVTNTGVIRADGGVVQLTASAADGVVQTLVRSGGTVRANTAGGQAGRIEIAGTGGSVVIEGRVSADGRAPGSVGGQVMVAGSDATVLSPSARITAGGRAGGGTVAVGTTLARARGGGPAPAGTSARTVVASGARISADAAGAGDGGRVTVLSTQSTAVDGTITARGGKQSGNGGTIELSGQTGFRLTGRADTSAPHGQLGSIVIDPRDLTITSTPNGTVNAAPANGVSPNLGAGAGGTTTDAFITPAQIGALTGNVVLQTTRDLTVASSFSYGGGNSLTLEAGRNLTINSGVTITEPGVFGQSSFTPGSLQLIAGSAAIPGYNPAGALTVLGNLSASGLTLSAGSGGVTLAGQLNTTGSFINTTVITTTGTVSQTGGSLITGNLFGNAGSLSLTQPTNQISAIGNNGAAAFTTTVGGFSVATTGTLTVGANANTSPTGIAVPLGQTISIQADTLNLLSGGPNIPALSAPGGTVILQPLSNDRGITISATAPSSVLGLTPSEANLITAGTLALNGNGASNIVFGQSGETVDFMSHGTIGALSLATLGIVSQGGPLLVSTLAAAASNITLTNPGNVIPSVSGLAGSSGGSIALTTSGDLSITGHTGAAIVTYVAGGNLTATGSAVITADSVTLTAGSPSVPGYNTAAQLSLAGTLTSLGVLNLNAGTGGIALTATVDANSLGLGTPGAVNQTAGSLTATDLFGTAGSVSLPLASNALSGVASHFTVTGTDFTLVDRVPLTIGSSSGNGGLSVPTGRNIFLTTDSLSISGADSGPYLSAPNGVIAIEPLTAATPITLTTGPKPANTLSLTTAELSQINAYDLILGGINPATNVANSGTITIGSGGGTIDLGSFGFGALGLNTTGAVVQAGALGISTLSTNVGSLALPNGSNFIGTLAGVAVQTDITLHSSASLAVGQVIAGGNVTLSSSGAQGMSIFGDVTGQTVNLNSLANGGTPTAADPGIMQNGGVISATTLTGAGGTASLMDANRVAQLGDFATYGSFTLVNALPLTVTGTVSSGLSSVALSAAGITQTAGSSILAPEFGGSSSADTVLTAPGNVIAQIGMFQQTAGNFTLSTSAPSLQFGQLGSGISAASGSVTILADQVGLFPNSRQPLISAPLGTVTFAPFTPSRPIELIGSGQSSAGALSLMQQSLGSIAAQTLQLGIAATATTPASTGPINIGNPGDAITLNSVVHTLNLVSTGTVTEGGGGTASLTVGTLAGNTGAANLAGSNQIGTLGGYGSSGAFQLNDTVPLAVNGPVASPVSIQLQTSAAMTVSGNLDAPAIALQALGGTLTQTAGQITAPGTLELYSSGLASQTGTGTIVAGTLTGITGALTLGQAANAITTIDTLNSGAVTLTNSQALTVTGLSFTGDTTLNVLSGGITLPGQLQAPNSTLTLNVAGPVATTGSGLLAAAALTGSAGSIDVTSRVATVGDFQSGGDFNLANLSGLTLAGRITAGTIELTSADMPRPSAPTVLGPIVQTGGSLAAGSISVQSSDVFNQQAGSITSTGALTIGSHGPITLAGTISGLDVQLTAVDKTIVVPGSPNTTSFGTVTQTAGSITAGTLSGSADSFVLTQAGNNIAQLGVLSATGATPILQLNDSRGLAVTGPVSAGNTAITLTTGDLTVSGPLSVNDLALTVAGNVIGAPGAAVDVAGVLSGTAQTLQFGNPVGVATLGNFTTTGNLTLAASGPLAATGTIGSGTAIVLSSQGPTLLSGNLSASSIQVSAASSVALGSSQQVVYQPGTITQTGGSLAATSLLQLTAGDTLTQSAGMIAGGSGAVMLSSVGTLSLGGTVSGGLVTLTAANRPAQPALGQTALAGTVVQTGGSLTAALLDGSSSGTTTLTQVGNAVATLASYSSNGRFALADGQALNVTGPVTDPVGAMFTTPGMLTLNGSVTTGALSLTAGGAITQPSGALIASSLSGSGAGVSLTQRGNQVGNLSGFASTGDFALTDGVGVTVAGTVSAGTGRMLTLLNDAPVFAPGGSLSAPGGTVTLAEYTPGAGTMVGGGGGLSGSPPVTAATLVVGLPAGGPVTVAGALNLSAVPVLDLESAGAITETGAGAIRVATLTGHGGSAGLGGRNQIGTIATFGTTTGFTLNNAQALTVAGPVTDRQSVSVAASGTLSVTGDITAPTVMLAATGLQNGILLSGGAVTGTGSVSLTSAGTIVQTGGTITAGTLTGSSQGTTSLGSTGNAVGTLGGFASAGGFSLADNQTLTVAGPVTDTTSVTLSAAGALMLNGTVQTGALNLTAMGAITQPGGALLASSLSGSGAGVSLTQRSNQVGTLGTLASSGDLSLTDATGVTIAGTVSAGQGRTLTLADDAPTFGAAGLLSAPAGTVALQEFTPGAGTVIGGGGGLSGSPPVMAAALEIGTPTGGPVTVAGPLDLSAVPLLDLESAAAITETGAGVIRVATLTGHGGSASLGAANQIGTLAAFATTTGFSLNNAQPLTVAGPVMDGQSVSIGTTGALTLSGIITAPSVAVNSASGPGIPAGIVQTAGSITATGSVSLTSAGTISQPGGTITAGTLTGSSAGTTSLAGPGNIVATLGAFGSTGGFSLADGQALAVTGPLTDRTSVTLSTPAALTLNGTVQTGSLSLTAMGAITQPGGALLASNLSGTGAGVSLNQPGNQVSNLSQFASTGDFALTDSVGVTVSGAVSAGPGRMLTLADNAPTFAGGSLAAPGGTVTLTESTPGLGLLVGGGGGLTGSPPVTAATLALGTPIGGPVTIAGALNLSTVPALDLESGGAITETAAGAIRVTTLTGHGASASLGGTNQVGTLGAFTTTAGFALTNTQPLTVSGPVTDRQSVSLATSGPLTVAGTITAPSVTLATAGGQGGINQTAGLIAGTATLALNAAGAISQTGGTISAGVLTGTANGPASLSSTGNTVGTLGAFSSTGGFALANGQALRVAGPVTDQTSVAFSVAGALSLPGTVQTGALTLDARTISQPGGSITASSLSAASIGDILLTQRGNQVSSIGTIAGSGDVAITDGVGVTIAGTVMAGAGHTLTLLDDAPSFGANGLLTVAGGTLLLGEFTPGNGVSLAGGSASGLPSVMAQQLTIGSATGGPVAIPVTLDIAGANVGLESAGTINAAGAIRALVLTGNGTSVSLGGTNQVGTLGPFTATAGFTLTDTQPLVLSGPLTASTLNLGITGGLTLTGPVVAPSGTSLTVTQGISQTGGSLTTGNLTGTAASVSLNAPGNAVAALGPFITPGGFSLTNGSGLVVAGPVNANAATLNVSGNLTLNGVLTTGAAVLNATGALAETGGSIAAPRLDGSGLSVSLAGSNTVGTLGNLSSQGVLLFTNNQALSITGTVTAGPALSVTAPGLIVSGTVQASSVTLNSGADLVQAAGSVTAPGALSLAATGPITTGGAIQAGTLTVGTQGGFAQTGGTVMVGALTGSAAGPISLGQAGTATINSISNLSSGTGITVVNSAPLQVGGTVAAPTVALISTGLMQLNGGTIGANGPGSSLQVLAGPDGGSAIQQVGTTTVRPFSGATSSLTLAVAASGGTMTFAGLTAPQTDVVLNLGSGSASGQVNVGNLLLQGSGGSASLTGSVRSLTGFDAAQVAQISPSVNGLYTLNGCAIGSAGCSPDSLTITSVASGVIASVARPDILVLDVLDLSITRDRDDPELLLPNISDRDY